MVTLLVKVISSQIDLENIGDVVPSPVCSVSVRGTEIKKKSQVEYNTLSPVWNSTMKFNVEHSETVDLLFDVYDFEDELDKSICTAEISVSEPDYATDGDQEILLKDSEESIVGTIKINVQMGEGMAEDDDEMIDDDELDSLLKELGDEDDQIGLPEFSDDNEQLKIAPPADFEDKHDSDLDALLEQLDEGEKEGAEVVPKGSNEIAIEEAHDVEEKTQHPKLDSDEEASDKVKEEPSDKDKEDPSDKDKEDPSDKDKEEPSDKDKEESSDKDKEEAVTKQEKISSSSSSSSSLDLLKQKSDHFEDSIDNHDNEPTQPKEEETVLDKLPEEPKEQEAQPEKPEEYVEATADVNSEGEVNAEVEANAKAEEANTNKLTGKEEHKADEQEQLISKNDLNDAGSSSDEEQQKEVAISGQETEETHEQPFISTLEKEEYESEDKEAKKEKIEPNASNEENVQPEDKVAEDNSSKEVEKIASDDAEKKDSSEERKKPTSHKESSDSDSEDIDEILKRAAERKSALLSMPMLSSSDQDSDESQESPSKPSSQELDISSDSEPLKETPIPDPEPLEEPSSSDEPAIGMPKYSSASNDEAIADEIDKVKDNRSTRSSKSDSRLEPEEHHSDEQHLEEQHSEEQHSDDQHSEEQHSEEETKAVSDNEYEYEYEEDYDEEISPEDLAKARKIYQRIKAKYNKQEFVYLDRSENPVEPIVLKATATSESIYKSLKPEKYYLSNRAELDAYIAKSQKSATDDPEKMSIARLKRNIKDLEASIKQLETQGK